MINSLNLRHFQSHKFTDLTFHPGVNAIIGTSNSGKSAIIRGLLWAWSNRPSGVDFVSHWNRDKNGNPKDPTSVTVGLQAIAIARVRSKTFNGYEVYSPEAEEHGSADHTLEAIGTDQPEEIAQAFNFSEVNIQRQMDTPFLLSDNAADVARFLNSIIRLDLIDRVLSAAEGRRRKVKASLEETQDQIKGLTVQVEGLSWITEAESLLGRAERVQARQAEKQAQRDTLAGQCTVYREETVVANRLEARISADGMVITLESVQLKLSQKQEARDRLARSIQDYTRAQDTIKLGQPIIRASRGIEQMEKLMASQVEASAQIKSLLKSLQTYSLAQAAQQLAWLDPAQALLAQTEEAQVTYAPAQAQASRLSDLIDDYKAQGTTRLLCTETITTLTASLPDTCPTCGKPLHEGAEHETA